MPPPSQQIHRAMQQAVALHQSGRFAEAERVYRDVLRLDARNADALQLLGLLEHQQGRHESAVELIRKAITIRPNAIFFLNLSQAYRALGRIDDCLEACRRVVQMHPTMPEGWNNLGSALKDVNRPAEAVGAFRKAIALRGDYAVAHNNLGNTLARLNQPVEAEAALRRTVAIDPNYAEGHSNLAHLLTRLGRLDESVAAARRAIALRPTLVAAYMNLGTALHLQGQFDEGQAAYARGHSSIRTTRGWPRTCWPGSATRRG
jgi:tetratricopeptide (TPR) repeat protein